MQVPLGRETSHVSDLWTTICTLVELQKHEFREKKIKSHVCDVCGHATSTLYEMKEHSISHSNHSIYCCSVCGRKFKHLNSLNRHKKLHKPRELHVHKEFRSQWCGIYDLSLTNVNYQPQQPSDFFS